MPRDSRNLKIYILSGAILLATFIFGAFTGAGIMKSFSPVPPGFYPPHGGKGGPSPMFHPLPLGELNLSEEQEQKIFKVMDAHKPELDAIFEETFPKLQKQTDKVEKEIRTLLTDPQKKQFDEMIRLRSQKQKKGPPPLPPPPPGMKKHQHTPFH